MSNIPPVPAAVPPPTELSVLLSMNVFKPIDGFIALANIALATTTVFWCLFGAPSPAQLLGVAVLFGLSLQAWSILLVLRVLRNILEIYVELQKSSDATVRKLYALANQP